MNSILIEETKKVLGYKEDKKECICCKFSVEREDMAHRWETFCTYSNVCEFRVENYASCQKYEPLEVIK